MKSSRRPYQGEEVPKFYKYVSIKDHPNPTYWSNQKTFKLCV